MSKIFKLCNELRNEFIKNRESTLYSVMQLTKNEINQDRYSILTIKNRFVYPTDNEVTHDRIQNNNLY